MIIFNSLSGKLAQFKPLSKKQVTVYVCGITPYDTTHLGHAFSYIFFDVLVRYLKFTGYRVIYTQNVTDINDRDQDLLQRAKEQNISWDKLGSYWTKKFLEDMNELNWTPPTYYLKASENLPQMIDLIKKLLKKRLAYEINGSVYLDISKYPHYGKLSRLNKDEMMTAAKDFEEDLQNPDKKDPLDITLWRGSTPAQPKHIPSFNSPFGKGRPGWHIECSAMAISSLGETIDIHGGGTDLKFPHHEAEIAQSELSTGKSPFAKYWLHTGTVFYQGEKMSKSKGNLVLVSDIVKKYSANALRWLLLSHHWSKHWEYKEEDLKKAQKNVETVEKVLASQGPTLQGDTLQGENVKQFSKIMDQNLNTSKALQFLLKLAGQKNTGLIKLYKILGFKVSGANQP